MKKKPRPNLRRWTTAKILMRLSRLEWKGNEPNGNMKLSTVFKRLEKFIDLEIRPPEFRKSIRVSREPEPYVDPEDAIIELLDKRKELPRLPWWRPHADVLQYVHDRYYEDGPRALPQHVREVLTEWWT